MNYFRHNKKVPHKGDTLFLADSILDMLFKI